MKTAFFTFILIFNLCIGYGQVLQGKGASWGKYLGGTETNDYSRRGLYDKFEVLNKALNNTIKIEGSPLLFEGWDNEGVIVLGDKSYNLNNLNYDINQDVILSRISEDSIFVFNFTNIDNILINDKEFKQFYDTGQQKNKIYEVMYENNNFSLLKGYYVVIVEGSPDPMVHRPNAKIRKKSSYYIMRNNLIAPFKWKKKSILNLIDDEKREELKKYVKNNNLSYNDESDVGKMLKIFSK